MFTNLKTINNSRMYVKNGIFLQKCIREMNHESIYINNKLSFQM